MSEDSGEAADSEVSEESSEMYDENGVPVQTNEGQSYNEYDTIDSITTKGDKPSTEEQTPEGYDEHELDRLVARYRAGEEVEYDVDEIKKHEERILQKVRTEKNKDSAYSSRLESLLRTLGLMVKNAFDITAGRYVVKKHNKATLDNLVEGDDVVVIVHGWRQNEGAFREYINQLKADGIKVVALTYNNSDLFGEGSRQIHDQIRAIHAKTGKPVRAIGHSDGGKVLINASINYGTDRYLDRIVLSQTDINGGRNKLVWQYLIGGLPASSNLAHAEGRRNIIDLNRKPVDCPVYEVTGIGLGSGDKLGDGLGRLVDNFYQHASRRARVEGATHFDGAGGSKYFNNVTTKAALDYGWNEFDNLNSVQGRAKYQKHTDDKKDIFNGRTARISEPGWYKKAA